MPLAGTPTAGESSVFDHFKPVNRTLALLFGLDDQAERFGPRWLAFASHDVHETADECIPGRLVGQTVLVEKNQAGAVDHGVIRTAADRGVVDDIAHDPEAFIDQFG